MTAFLAKITRLQSQLRRWRHQNRRCRNMTIYLRGPIKRGPSPKVLMDFSVAWLTLVVASGMLLLRPARKWQGRPYSGLISTVEMSLSVI